MSGTSLQVLAVQVFEGDAVELERETLHAAVLDAKGGDEQAFGLLARGFALLLRKQARPFAGILPADEVRTAALIGLLEAVSAVEVPEAFASVVGRYVQKSLRLAAGEVVPVPVPERTLARYLGVMREAGGDVEAAALLAESFHMSRETFYAVRAALSAASLESPGAAEWVGSLAVEEWEAPEVLCAAAFEALDAGPEVEVVEAAYGFSDYRPHSDSEIAGDLGWSRPKVQRVRSGALVKMREALCVSRGEE